MRAILHASSRRGLIEHIQGERITLSISRASFSVLCSKSSNIKLNHNLTSEISSPREESSISKAAEALLDVADEKALVDLFGRKHNYLRVSLTEKCNFRCVYCMPAEGVQLTPSEQLPTLTERKRLLDIFARLGVNKLRFTGGEPTLSKQLLPLLQHAQTVQGPNADLNASAFRSIGITTNGFNFKQQLPDLVAAGLTSANISLDSLVEHKFAALTRRDGKAVHRVLSAIYASLDAGLHTKINCVLMAGTNDDEIADFVKLTRDMQIDVRFIEYMPFDGNGWHSQRLVGYRDALQRLEVEHGIILQPDTKTQQIRVSAQGEDSGGLSAQASDGSANGIRPDKRGGSNYNSRPDVHDTTKWYRAEGHVGRVGFISTMTDHFCSTCNRLRLTADGKLKVCLFGDEALSLVSCLRKGLSDGQIIAEMAAAVRRKAARLGGEQNAVDLAATERKNRSMIKIGG